MRKKLTFLALICIAAAEGQPAKGLDFQYLSADFSQDVAAFARDYVGDPGSSLDQKETIKKPSHFLSGWPADRSYLVASVSRERSNGLVAKAASSSYAAYNIDPFSLSDGFAWIKQLATSQTYYVPDSPEGVLLGEAYARVGMGGDKIGFRFLIDESVSTATLRIRMAWSNGGVVGGQHGSGEVFVDWQRVLSGSSNSASATIQLAPGEHMLELTKWGFDAGPYLHSGNTIGQFAASWTFGLTFVGVLVKRHPAR